MYTKIDSKQVIKSTLSTLQNVAPPLAGIATRLSMITPEWALMIGLGSGLLAYWRDVAVVRGEELFKYIEEHQAEFGASIVKSSDFQATLLNVWEMHIRENSEAKRKRLRRFLLALGKGEEIPADLHSKIYSVVNQMTDDEAFVFGHLYRNTDREKHANMNFNASSMKGIQKFVDYQLRDIFNSLHAYRLISLTEATMGGVMMVRQITPFGDIFYEHVLSEEA